MADLTPGFLAELRRIAAELRRIAAETTPGTHEWRIIETTLELTIETALALLDRIEALEAENERLRREREVLAEVLKHVRTCEDCECALCPQGTGLSLRAYRALKEGSRCDS